MTTEDLKIVESIDANDKPVVTIHSPKFKEPFVISKEVNGFSFFKISMGAGKTAGELSGSYTRMKEARLHVEDYIKRAKKSGTVKRDENTAARLKQKREQEKQHG